MNESLLIPACAFAAVTLLGYFVTSLLAGRDDGRIRDRLRDRDGENLDSPVLKSSRAGLRPFLERMGQAAAVPFMPKSREKQSGLRQQLGRAGIYSPQAIRMVTGCKVILLCVGLVGGYVVGAMLDKVALGLSFGGLIGYMVAVIWLKAAIATNQKALTHGLPDALDLMVVCVEAGLSVDAGMQRLGTEMALAHPAISREFGIAHMETRVGLSRADAMRNLGLRTG